MKKKFLFYFFNFISQEKENEIVINSVDTYKESQENENEIVVNPIENHKEKPEEIKKKNKKIYTYVALFCLLVFVFFLIIYLYNRLKRCIIKGQMEENFAKYKTNIYIHIKKEKNTDRFFIEVFDKAKPERTTLKRETNFLEEFLLANPVHSMAKYLLENKTFANIEEDLKDKQKFFFNNDSIDVSVETFLSCFSYVQISVKTKPIERQRQQTTMVFNRVIKTGEKVQIRQEIIHDRFLTFLQSLFVWSCFYNIFTNEDDPKKVRVFICYINTKKKIWFFQLKRDFLKKKQYQQKIGMNLL